MDHSAKILLLGQTGVGKSAFINYYLGKKVAESAAGKPVTQEYFIPYKIEDGKYPVEIYDTKGVESLSAYNQLNEIVEGVTKRNKSDDIFNWFHTIFYCVSMANRFEDFEAEFIRKLQEDLTQHIHIILTHCDTCKEDRIVRMKERIRSLLGKLDNIEIFEVVCISKKKRNGEIVQPRGKEIVSERVFDLLLEDIADKISKNYASCLRKSMIDGANFALQKAEKFVDNTIRLKTLIEYIQDSESAEQRVDAYADQLQQEIENAIDNTNQRFSKILQPVAQLYTSYWSVVTDSFTEDAELDFESFVDIEEFIDVNDLGKTLFPNMYKKGYMDEDGEFIDIDDEAIGEIITALALGIGDLLNMKKNMKKYFRKVHKQFIGSIPKETTLQQKTYERIIEYIKP